MNENVLFGAEIVLQHYDSQEYLISISLSSIV